MQKLMKQLSGLAAGGPPSAPCPAADDRRGDDQGTDRSTDHTAIDPTRRPSPTTPATRPGRRRGAGRRRPRRRRGIADRFVAGRARRAGRPGDRRHARRAGPAAPTAARPLGRRLARRRARRRRLGRRSILAARRRVDRPRRSSATCRPAASMYGEVRMDLPGRPAPEGRGVPVAVPGLRRPGGPRDQGRRGPSTRWSGRPERQADLQARTSSRGSRASSRSASGSCPTAGASLRATAVDSTRALALLSIKDAALAQAWFDAPVRERRHDRRPRPTTAPRSHDAREAGRRTGRRSAWRSSTARSRVIGDHASVKAAIDTNGDGAFAERARAEGRVRAADGDHLGFVYIGARKLCDWSAALAGVVRARGASPASIDAMLDAAARLGRRTGVRVESDALVMREDLAAAGEGAPARPPTAARRSPRTSRPARSPWPITNDYGDDPPAGDRPLQVRPRFEDGIEQTRRGRSSSSAASTRSSAGSATPAVVVNAPTACPSGGVVIVADRRRRGEPFLTSSRPRRARRRPAGHHVRDEDHSGTTITIVDLGDLRPRSWPAAGDVLRSRSGGTSRSPARSRTTSSSSAAAPASSSTSSTRPRHVARRPAATRPRRSRRATAPALASSTSRRSASWSRPLSAGRPARKLRDRRQAVPRPVRRLRRVELGRGRSRPTPTPSSPSSSEDRRAPSAPASIAEEEPTPWQSESG